MCVCPPLDKGFRPTDPLVTYTTTVSQAGVIYGQILDNDKFADTEGLPYRICTSKALQPSVSLAFLFNRPLMFFSADINAPGAQMILELCPLTCLVASRRLHTIDIGVSKIVTIAQKTYSVAIIKGEPERVPISGSVEQA